MRKAIPILFCLALLLFVASGVVWSLPQGYDCGKCSGATGPSAFGWRTAYSCQYYSQGMCGWNYCDVSDSWNSYWCEAYMGTVICSGWADYYDACGMYDYCGC